jgi:hypothetical protein
LTEYYGAVEKVFYNRKVRKGLRKARKVKAFILNTLCPLRKIFAIFAVNGF